MVLQKNDPQPPAPHDVHTSWWTRSSYFICSWRSRWTSMRPSNTILPSWLKKN